MEKIIYLLFFSLLIFILPESSAQDVAVCGWDASGSTSSGDEVSFVLLRDFAAGEVIYITEDEYSDASNSFNSSEGHLAFTVPAGGLLANEVVSIVESSEGNYTEQCGTGGTVTGMGSWSLAADAAGGMADEIYIYSASNPAAPWSSVTAIHCLAWSAVSAFPTDQDPSPDYPDVLIIAWNLGGPSGFNSDFMDASRVNTVLTDLQDGANWSKANNTNSPANISLSCTDFSFQVLPVELTSFQASLRGSEVLLDWVTESEVNNERFEIEHSEDGRIFNAIASISGKGNSNETNFYQMVHDTPNEGKNYYRLKQVDFDGSFSFSDIVVVQIESDQHENLVYPNPFEQSLRIQFSLKERQLSAQGSQFFEVFDIHGKLVHVEQAISNEPMVTLNLSKLHSGVYFLKYTDGQGALSTHRIMKL